MRFICIYYHNGRWSVCEVSLKCFLSPLFSMSGLSSVRSSSLIESFCILTLHSYLWQIFCVCTENGWGCFMMHADTILVLMNLYLSWKHVFDLFMLLFIDFFKLWDSVEVVCHALLILCCIVKRWLYVHNYWWTHNKINHQLFFHDWFLFLFSTYHINKILWFAWMRFISMVEQIFPVGIKWIDTSRQGSYISTVLIKCRGTPAFT